MPNRKRTKIEEGACSLAQRDVHSSTFLINQRPLLPCRGVNQTSPWSIMAFATFRNPAMLAPFT
jgi:hypothetical protein